LKRKGGLEINREQRERSEGCENIDVSNHPKGKNRAIFQKGGKETVPRGTQNRHWETGRGRGMGGKKDGYKPPERSALAWGKPARELECVGEQQMGKGI